jgi:glycosyltransferase involved in cell wall biosynthesis
MVTNGNSSSELPLITIGITCYNAEDTIGRAIDSARGQVWPKLEIIVVDDGSSDGSQEIIREFAAKDDRIKSIRHDVNRGYAGALNSIVEAARGEYIAVFDDDDVSASDRIAKQWNRITHYAEALDTDLIFCYANRTVVEYDSGRSVPAHAIGRKPVEPRGAAVADFILWHYEDPAWVWGQFGSCTLFARKQTLAEVGPLDECFRRSAEWDLAIRLALMGGHFIAVDEPLVTQYKTPTADKSGRQPLEYAVKLRRKHQDYLKAKNVYLAAVAIAHSRFYYATGRLMLSRFYLALACMCSPSTVLPNELAKRKQRKSRPAKFVIGDRNSTNIGDI